MDPSREEEDTKQLLSDERDRAILSTLRDTEGPLDLRCLAERLVAHDHAILGATEFKEQLDRLRISLHHERLPKLAEAGLLEYDRVNHVITESNSLEDEMESLNAEQFHDLLTPFFNGHEGEENAVGIIEGRENTLDYGRQITDQADEEVFCMFAGEEILKTGCLASAKAAIERGVNVYLGTPDPELREAARERLPEATIWEPQFDWLNDPMQYPTIGRVVVVDRESVLVTLVEESQADETYVETGMTGVGESNPLVVLVRELLGPRLDHLDYQSETFEDDLPFEL